MQINSISNFLGVTSNRFESNAFKASIVDYDRPVSEDWHYHQKIHISSILTGGNLESRKNNDFQVEPGKIITYQEGEVHRNRHTVFPSKNLNIELEKEFFNDEIKFSNFLTDHHSYLSLIKVYYELTLNDNYSDQCIDQVLKSLFWSGEKSKKPEWIQVLKILLNDRWDEFIPLSELSEQLNLHPISISKYFAKYSNCTLGDYMRKLKVERAIGMLLNSTHSIAEITFKCGFSDQSHMTRLFKYYVGFTPKAIRSI